MRAASSEYGQGNSKVLNAILTWSSVCLRLWKWKQEYFRLIFTHPHKNETLHSNYSPTSILWIIYMGVLKQWSLHIHGDIRHLAREHTHKGSFLLTVSWRNFFCNFSNSFSISVLNFAYKNMCTLKISLNCLSNCAYAAFNWVLCIITFSDISL